jgi:valyl-tRNA synthetase
MISGWCLASDKTKMSKSKGNVITPLSLLQEKSADAVRHWASTAKLGTDTAFSEDLLKIGAKLTNKLWNAAKFASAQLEAIQGESASATAAIQAGIITCEIDKWLIARTQATIAACDTCFADYDYSGARIAVEDLFWNDFCDNYLEIVKARAYGQQGEGAQQSALHTIYHVFNAILKLFAPFIPHITEELFAKLYQGEFEKCDSIHARGNFPNVANFESGIKSTNDWDITKAIVELIRKAKSERGVSIKYPLEVAAITGISDELFAAISDDIKAVGNITTLHNQLLTQAHAVLQDSELQLSVVFADEAEVA